MFLQTVATLTTAITLAATTIPASGEAPTFGNEPVVTYDSVVQNFRQTNQLLLAVEDASQQMEPEREARIEPVLQLLEEQLTEAASQLTAADQIEHQGMARVSAKRAKVEPEVYEGINSDITSVTSDLKRLASAIGTSEYL